MKRLRKHLARPVHVFRFWWRMRQLRAHLTELAAAASAEAVALERIARLRTIWGNEGWSADAGFLTAAAREVWDAPGPVLDCGSGLSTVIFAVIAARHGGRVWSLEQDGAWHSEMTRVLQALGIENVLLWHAPLKIYGEFVWYDLQGRELPPHFPVVSCDGPAVTRSPFPEQFQAWRVGVAPVLRLHGVTVDTILLDDAEDPRSPGVVAQWRREGLQVVEGRDPDRHVHRRQERWLGLLRTDCLQRADSRGPAAG